jgi:hypothetical protein
MSKKRNIQKDTSQVVGCERREKLWRDLIGAQAGDSLHAAAVQLQHTLMYFTGLIARRLAQGGKSDKPEQNGELACSESPKSSWTLACCSSKKVSPHMLRIVKLRAMLDKTKNKKKTLELRDYIDADCEAIVYLTEQVNKEEGVWGLTTRTRGGH